MDILKAKKENIDICVDIIFPSEIGKKYYPRRDILEKKVKEGIRDDEMYLCKKGNEYIGLIWYKLNGMFNTFPYLHMIIVKEEYQNKGIGSLLMDFFEKDSLNFGQKSICTKVFLTVGDFNKKAEELYLKRGYKNLFEIKGLYRRKITEKIFMKVVVKKD